MQRHAYKLPSVGEAMSRFVGTLKEKAERLGLSHDLVNQRLRRGWSEKDALSTPVGDRRPDRPKILEGLHALTGTMVAAELEYRLKGDDKRADIVNKLISGE